MKIVFLSNYFNHHQMPLCESLSEMADEFLFVATSYMRDERVKLGYQNIKASYIVHIDEDKGRFSIQKAIRDADAVIIGSAPEEFISSRLKSGKLVFRYCERPMKQPPGWRFLPEMLRWRKRNPAGSNIYLLGAGAYVAGDFERFGLFRDRAFQWGYFPDVRRYEQPERMVRQKAPNSLLWVGRFLDWKHPEMAVEAARYLKEHHIPFSLEMIGSGPMESDIKNLIQTYRLENEVTLPGTMSPEAVRQRMENAEILLFTSDRQEGWGAVLNEAMNSGCAVVASSSIGSVPFLLRDTVNGVVFESENTDMLCEKTRCLMSHRDFRQELGIQAYNTVTQLWNAHVAAKRLIKVIECLREGGNAFSLYADGPCSKAPVLFDNQKGRESK